MDPITIGLLVGGGAGLLKGAKNEKKMKEHAKFREAALRYSPWTGMGDPGDLNLPGMLESGLQGGALGATVGNLVPAGGATGSLASGTSAATGGMAPAGMINAMAAPTSGAAGVVPFAGASEMNPEMMKWLLLNQQAQG